MGSILCRYHRRDKDQGNMRIMAFISIDGRYRVFVIIFFTQIELHSPFNLGIHKLLLKSNAQHRLYPLAQALNAETTFSLTVVLNLPIIIHDWDILNFPTTNVGLKKSMIFEHLPCRC